MRLLQRAQPTFADTRFEPLQPSEPGPVVAVDGSHAVLVDNGSTWVVAYRATAVAWPGPAPLPVEPEVVGATPEEAQGLLDRAYAAWGLEPPRVAGADSFAAALRALAEAQAAVQAAGSLPRGGLLLVDGALLGLPPAAQALADRILNAGRLHGVRVVGIAKRSGISRDGTALVPALSRLGPAGAWAVEVEPGVFVARLHPSSPFAFRVDGSRADLGRLLPLSRDAVYVGYPYPLAVAHNAVALTAGTVSDLKERLRTAAARLGGAEAVARLADFHETLDRNVPG